MILFQPLDKKYFNEGRVSSPYGPRWGTIHKGTDLRLPIGNPVYTIEDGIVRESRSSWDDPTASRGRGWFVRIEHPQHGIQSLYAHLDQRSSLRPGDKVSMGDQIGISGNTGNSTGPHLHLEIWEGESPVDPFKYFPELQGKKTSNINKIEEEKKYSDPNILTTRELKQKIKSFNWTRKISKIHPHHTYRPNKGDYNGSNGMTLHNNMKRYHMNTKGFRDIAQHLTLLPDGHWIIGRDWNTIPASMSGNNTGAFMTEMIGDFHTGHEQLEGAQLEAIANWCSFCMDFFKLDINAIEFHREHSATACPGAGITKKWFLEQVEKEIKGQSIAPTKPQTNGTHYTVQAKDTLWGIAQGLPGITHHDLMKWNNIQDATELMAGQRITISAPSKSKDEVMRESKKEIKGDTYKMKRGDTLYSVARRIDGVTHQELQEWNEIEDVTKISTGTALKLTKPQREEEIKPKEGEEQKQKEPEKEKKEEAPKKRKEVEKKPTKEAPRAVFNNTIKAESDLRSFSKSGEQELRGDLYFSDLPAKHWGYDYAKILANNNIVRIPKGDKLNPNEYITRMESIALIARLIKEKNL